MTGIYHKVIGRGVMKRDKHTIPFKVALALLNPIKKSAIDARRKRGIMRIIRFL
jgi:hypothetical protein